MVGKKTFRCLLFSLSDVAKMVKKVDVPIPACIKEVIDGNVSNILVFTWLPVWI